MNIGRIVAIVFIYLLAAGGWWILAATTWERSVTQSGRLGSRVEELWGRPLTQPAPSWTIEVPGTDSLRWLMPEENRIDVRLAADYRKKGLIWYPTYTCLFSGAYTIANTEEVAQKVHFRFDFPAKGATYDGFAITVDDEPLATGVNTNEGIHEIIELAPSAKKVLRIVYGTRGMGEWRYAMDRVP